jgi:endonuclease/exonuclease/phosphatase family metal-dependent hydrolase
MAVLRRVASIVLLALGVPLFGASGAAPAIPSSPDPADGASGVSLTTTLAWATDPNARSFDIYFGTTTTPALAGSANKFATYNPGPLTAATTYYWRVVARGTGGSTATGPLWRFTTAGTPPPPPATTAVNRLKLMTWNVQDGYDASGLDAVDAQVALMADANADVIGLHEVGVSTGRDLSVIYRDKLQAATGRTWYRVWAPIPMQPSPGGNLVLSRIPIVSASIRQFDAAPADPSWSGAKRSAAQVELDVNGKRLHVFFTHLDTDTTTRGAQLTMLLDWVGTFNAPRLLGGDFNMMPTEGDYARVTDRFDDGWWSLVERFQAAPGPDKGYTKNVRSIAPWTGQPGRIDYWFHEKNATTVIPTEIAVLETQRSDHHALLMWVKVQ